MDGSGGSEASPTAREPLEVVRHLYDAWNAGDVAGAAERSSACRERCAAPALTLARKPRADFRATAAVGIGIARGTPVADRGHGRTYTADFGS